MNECILVSFSNDVSLRVLYRGSRWVGTLFVRSVVQGKRIQLSATSYTPGGYKDPWLDWLQGLPANLGGV